MVSNPFSSKGRVRRLHFFIAWVVLNVMGKLLDAAVDQPGSSSVLYVFYAILVWPSVALMVQRAHDGGRSGIFVAQALGLMLGSVFVLVVGAGLLDEQSERSMLTILAAVLVGAIFLVGLVMTLIVYFAPGNPEANEYGPNPRLEVGMSSDVSDPAHPQEPLIDLAARRGFNTGD